ncbi:MAG TPA: four-carbon acid sugar kinase family protein [Lacunisphaera sp.]|nr:four-carbon acid sugar kinase family protein [Lacunisphaera sp.]
MSHPALKLAYYADDFTGSTDALESLAQAGLQARLFLSPPTAEQCAGLDAVGVAGFSRSLAPAAMEAVLRPAFTSLRALGPRHVHYKVCSTFDSSPTVGSIGRAIDVGAGVFGSRTVPLLVAAPALGRYCAFGNLYARFGIGSDGPIHRLDRHPAISRHPVTPMTEADLRVHLAGQTKRSIALLGVPALELPPAETAAAFDRLVEAGCDIILIDGLNAAHLLRAGALIDRLAGDGPVFSVGSSGIESALCAHWATEGAVSDRPNVTPSPAGPVPASGPLLVVSGSCSPVTGGQIDWAIANRFTGIEFSPDALPAVVASLKSGRSTVVYTSRGQASNTPVPAGKLGTELGLLTREAIARTGVRRIVIAGGDTSSFATRALGIESLEMLATLAPGAPFCRVRAPGSPVDGLEVNFKGGQVGAPDFFGTAERGILKTESRAS